MYWHEFQNVQWHFQWEDFIWISSNITWIRLPSVFSIILVSEDSEKEDDAMENIKFLSSRALFLEEGNDSSDNEDEKYS